MVAVPMPGPGFMQVCWLVPDLEAAIDTWATTAGVGPFFWFDGVPFEDGRHRGVPAEYPPSTAAIAYSGDVQIELVCQENDAPGVFRDVFPLGEHGLHHLARICHDYEAERDAVRWRRATRSRSREPSAAAAPAGSTPWRRSVSWSSSSSPATRGTAGSPTCARPRSGGTAATASSAARLPIADSAMKGAELASTFPELLARTVASRPEHLAVITGDESVTYDELDRRSAEMAQALLAAGAGKGTRIGLLAPDGVLWLTTFYAALRIGALITPISTLAAPPELAHIVRRSDVQILIGVRSFLRRDFADLLAAALPELTTHRGGALQLGAAPLLRSVWLDDAEGVPWAGTLATSCSGTPRRRTNRCWRRSSWSCRRPTTRSSSTPRGAPRPRRRWCTHSAPSPASPRCSPSYFGITADPPDDEVRERRVGAAHDAEIDGRPRRHPHLGDHEAR